MSEQKMQDESQEVNTHAKWYAQGVMEGSKYSSAGVVAAAAATAFASLFLEISAARAAAVVAMDAIGWNYMAAMVLASAAKRAVKRIGTPVDPM